MTELFKHIILPQNSSTSPVENLAEEVANAFEKTENIIISTSEVVPNYSKVIGTFALKEIRKHNKTTDFSEAFTVQEFQQNISLSAIPTSIANISYYDSISSTTIVLDQVSATQEFTSENQYKIIGKDLYLSGNFTNKTLSVLYSGTTPSLGSLSGYSNVIKNTDNEHILTPIVTASGFTLVYDFNVQLEITDLFRHGIAETDYIYFIGYKNNEGFVNIPYNSFSLNGSNVDVITDEDLNDIDNIFTFMINISLSEFIENLYLDYIEHSHNSTDNVSSISHTDLLNTYLSTNQIFYKDINVPNYPHPQYLNREGYNPTLDEIYNNALLGDLFISSLISPTDQNYKTLTKDSNSIIFGDPITGHKVHYNTEYNILNISSGSTTNGLNVSTGADKKGLTINNTTEISETTDNTVIKPKDGHLNIVNDNDESLLTVDNIKINNKADIEDLETSTISIGGIVFESDNDGNVEVDSSNPTSTITFNKLKANKIEVKDLEAENYHLLENNRIYLNDTNYLINTSNQYQFYTDKSVDFYSTGRNKGISIGTPSNGKMNTYYSNSTGEGLATINDFYIETPQQSGTYLLKSTNEIINYNSNNYTFNNPISNYINITDLKQWFRSDLFTGNLDAYKLTLRVSDTVSRNGLTIGNSSLYVVGSEVDCPEGITILESLNDFHFINTTRQDTGNDCTSLSYQNVNTGNLQVFGNLSADGDTLILGNITTNSDFVGQNLTVQENIQTDTLTALGLTRLSTTQITGDLSSSGNFIVNGSIESKGDLSGNNLRLSNSAEVSGSLSVGRQAYFGADVSISGTLNIENGFNTNGKIESNSLVTGDITGTNLELYGTLSVSGRSELLGPLSITGNTNIIGNTNIEGSTSISQDLTAKTLYILDDAVINGRFRATNTVTLESPSITLGTSSSVVTINGSLQLNNPLTTLTGNVDILENLNVYGITTLNDNTIIKGSLQATSLSIASSATINGNLKADSGEFTRKVTFTDGLKATGISEITRANIDELTTKNINTDEMYINVTLNMGAESVIKTNRLETSQILQNNPAETSSFVGPVSYSNEVSILNKLLIGNKNIENTRDTSGILITDNTIKMGNNSLINAVKIFAGKGAPRDGDIDRTGGYCFQSPTSIGTSDGDTGMFATLGSGAGTENSNLQFYIDGTKKGEFLSSPVTLPSYEDDVVEDPEKAKVIFTYDMFLLFKQQMKEAIDNAQLEATAKAWPLGSIYQNSRDIRNPSHPELLGIGVWIPYAAGRVIIGMTSIMPGGSIEGGLTPPSTLNLNAIGAIDGAYTHTLTIPEMPNHNHAWKIRIQGFNGGWNIESGSGGEQYTEDYMHSTGGDQPHNNVQPVKVAAIWERIA